jgi:hypothetical protein
VEEGVRKGIVDLLKSDPVVDLVLRVNCTAIEAEIGVDLSNYKNALDIYVLFHIGYHLLTLQGLDSSVGKATKKSPCLSAAPATNKPLV